MPGTYDFEDLLLKLSTPFYLFLIGLEIFLTYRTHSDTRTSYSFRDSLTNALLMLVNGGIDLLFRAVYVGILIWFYNFSVVPRLKIHTSTGCCFFCWKILLFIHYIMSIIIAGYSGRYM
jgi:Na+/serine symporter